MKEELEDMVREELLIGNEERRRCRAGQKRVGQRVRGRRGSNKGGSLEVSHPPWKG